MRDAIAADVHDDLRTYSTSGWHPLGVEAALATLDVWEAQGERILRNARNRGEQMRDALSAMEWREPAMVRRKGLAVDVGDEEYAKEIVERCKRKGVLLTHGGSTVRMFPPPTIPKRTVAEAMQVVARATG